MIAQYAPDLKWVEAIVTDPSGERLNPAKAEANWSFWIHERRLNGTLLVRLEIYCHSKEILADVHAWISARYPKDRFKTLWTKPEVLPNGSLCVKCFRILGHHMEEHRENIRKRDEAAAKQKRLKLVPANDYIATSEPRLTTVQSLG